MERAFVDLFHEEIFKWFCEFIDAHICNDFPERNNGKGITDGFHIRENMSIEEKGFSFILELKHQVLHHFTSDGIQSTHRFIEKNEFGVMENRLSESDTLEHSFRIRIESLVASMD